MKTIKIIGINVINILITFVIILLIIIFTTFVLTRFFDLSEPQGVGGFVYQEIEWAEQTKNIIIENCGKENTDYVQNLHYDHYKNQFYCYKYYDCDKKGGCRSKEWYYPVILK